MKKIALVVGAIVSAVVLASCSTPMAAPQPVMAPAAQPMPMGHHHHDYKGELGN